MKDAMNNKNTLFFILLAASILNVDCCRAAAAAPQDTPEFHDFIRDIAKGNEERIVQTLLQHPTFLEHTVPYSVMENHSKDEDKPTLKAMFNKLPIKPFDIAYLLRHYDIARSLHKRGHVSFDKMNLSNIFTFLIKRDKTKELEYILNNSTNVEDALLAQAIAKNRKNVDVEDWITRTYKDKIEAAEKNNLLVVKQKGSSLQPVDPSKIAQFAKQAQASRGVQTPAIQAPDQKDQEFQDFAFRKTQLFAHLMVQEFDAARTLLRADPSLANGAFTEDMLQTVDFIEVIGKLSPANQDRRLAKPDEGATLVGEMIAFSNTAGLRLLHSEFQADLQIPPVRKGNLLHLAARKGVQSAIEYLVDNGFDLEKPDGKNRTPYQLAKTKHPRIAAYIQQRLNLKKSALPTSHLATASLDDVFAEIEATGAPSKTPPTQSQKQPNAKKKKPKPAALTHKPTPPAQSNKQAKLPEQPASPEEEQQPPQQAVQEKAPVQKPPLLPAAKALSQAQAQQQEKLRKKQQEDAKLRKKKEEQLAKEAADKKAVEQARLAEQARLEEQAKLVADEQQRIQLLAEQARQAALLNEARADLAPEPAQEPASQQKAVEQELRHTPVPNAPRQKLGVRLRPTAPPFIPEHTTQLNDHEHTGIKTQTPQPNVIIQDVPVPGFIPVAAGPGLIPGQFPAHFPDQQFAPDPRFMPMQSMQPMQHMAQQHPFMSAPPVYPAHMAYMDGHHQVYPSPPYFSEPVYYNNSPENYRLTQQRR